MSDFTPNAGQKVGIQASPDRPVRVVAGAGTGKTEVISRRFVYLLEQNKDWRPENILVLTFSEKAAAEMRARIFRTVARGNLGFNRLDLAAASISTFHSLGARLLHDHSLRARIDPDLPFLSTIDVQDIMAEAEQVFLKEGYQEAYEAFNPLDSDAYTWEDGGPFGPALKLIGQLRNQGIGPREFLNRAAAVKSPSDRHRVLAPLVGWMYGAYIDELAERGQLDFDRLIMDAAILLESDGGLRQDIRRRFRTILVDEYQDTNLAQERFLRALAADGMANVTVVGDPRQAIYVWREARVENIARFPGQAGERLEAPLIENRRSLQPILDAANRAIEGYEFSDLPEFPAGTTLRPFKDNKKFEGVVVNLQAAPTREDESRAVAGWVKQAMAEGYAFRDVAILIRARTHLGTYLDALQAAGIPFELSADDAFYTRPEILDAIHLLNVCLNPAGELSLARTLLSPAVGLTQAQAAQLRQQADKPLWQAVVGLSAAELGDDVAGRLSRFAAFWGEAQKQRWLLSPAAFVGWAVRRSGLQAASDALGQRALQKLFAVAHAYEAEHPAATLRELASYLRRLLEGDPREKAPELRGDADAVRVLTVHASKGLEFPVVIAVDNRQKVKPNRDRQPFHEPDAGLVFPEDNEVDTRFVDRTRRARNEARCLWYVMLTRAKRRLVITATNEAELNDGRYPKTSTFFEELWNKEMESPTPGVALGASPPEVELAPVPQAEATDVADALPAARALDARLRSRLSPAKPEIRVSPTAFRRYQQCPASYRYYHGIGLDRVEEYRAAGEEQEDGGGTGVPLGLAFHQAVAAHARRPEAAVGELLSVAAAGLPGAPTAEQRETLRGWLERYVASELGRMPPKPGWVERALSLTLEFESARLVLTGFADRLESGRLVDYKTDADRDGLVDRYGDQLRLYAMAARAAGLLSPDAELVLYHAPTAAQLRVAFAPEDESRLMAELESFAGALARVDAVFTPTPHEGCRWCAARETVCAAGQQWLSGE